jgi:hypothetical protein
MFQPGNNFSKGRAAGAKNRLSRAFLEALEKSFNEHGEKAMEVEWIEHPLEMLKLIAHLEPRQLKYEGVAAGLSDEQLAAVEAVLIEAQAQIVDAKPQALEAPEEKPGRIKVIGVSRHEKESLNRS